MLKKILVFCLSLALIAAVSVPAMAASSPVLNQSVTTLYLHPSDIGYVQFTIKNVSHSHDLILSAVKNAAGVVVSTGYTWDKTNSLISFNAPSNQTTVYKCYFDLAYIANETPEGGGTPNTLNFVKTVTIKVADNFVPRIRWSRILINEANGYPQLKLSMTDDWGLMDICFVRNWTDENGAAQREIYDIISLYDQMTAVVFRTLDKPGEYSVQINDNYAQLVAGAKTGRFNSKTLITLVDTDKNGVADAYFTDDPAALTALDVEGGITPVATAAPVVTTAP